MEKFEIIDTSSQNIHEFGICGYKNKKREGFIEKIGWIKKNESNGLRIKTLYLEKGKNQGMIEYIPGEYAFRPVYAKGYIFIHCIMVGFKKEYKNQGYGTLLLEQCEKDAKENSFKGVAVVVRKGSFMASKNLFEKNGYLVTDSVKPDFLLLAKKFDADFTSPSFKKINIEKTNGLKIFRAFQCPYTVKNVNEIVETAVNYFKIKPNIIELKTYKEAQKSPSPFGSFAITFNGKLISEHPISSKRFFNIMKKEIL